MRGADSGEGLEPWAVSLSLPLGRNRADQDWAPATEVRGMFWNGTGSQSSGLGSCGNTVLRPHTRTPALGCSHKGEELRMAPLTPGGREGVAGAPL